MAAPGSPIFSVAFPGRVIDQDNSQYDDLILFNRNGGHQNQKWTRKETEFECSCEHLVTIQNGVSPKYVGTHNATAVSGDAVVMTDRPQRWNVKPVGYFEAFYLILDGTNLCMSAVAGDQLEAIKVLPLQENNLAQMWIQE